MKSGKQRRTEIKEKRAQRKAQDAALSPVRCQEAVPIGAVAVNEELLAPYNSYGTPDFVRRGYYEDLPFRCADCGKEEVWTATRQKWWYEVAKGYVDSTARRCRECRRTRRERSMESRRVHMEGLARKASGGTSIQNDPECPAQQQGDAGPDNETL